MQLRWINREIDEGNGLARKEKVLQMLSTGSRVVFDSKGNPRSELRQEWVDVPEEDE